MDDFVEFVSFSAMLCILVYVSNAGAMAENNTGWIRLWRMSQTALVQLERVAAKTTRPRVAENSFDIASNLQPRGSHASSSRSRLSQAYEVIDSEASKPHGEVVVDVLLESYSLGLFETSLLQLYVDHVARHVWEGEVYFFSFRIDMFSTN